MAIETEANLLGGTTYEVSWDADLAELPAVALAAVDDFDRDVFAQPEAYAAHLAANCTYPPMRRWLEVLAASHFTSLLVHCAEVEKGDRTVSIREVYFRFFHMGLERMFDVQFQKDGDLEVIHPALMPVFENVARIETREWMAAGGQLGYDEGDSGLMSWVGFDDEADRTKAGRTRILYMSGDGYPIGCRDDGLAVRYEPCRLIEFGPVEDFLATYLNLLIGDEAAFDKVIFTEEIVALVEARRAGSVQGFTHPAPPTGVE